MISLIRSGYLQCLCGGGHLFNRPLGSDALSEVCPECGSVAAWTNRVENSHDLRGIIPLDVWNDQFLKYPARTQQCNLGHMHAYAPSYEFPTEDERARFQHYFNGEEYVPLNNLPVP